jgi:DNA topoisomerase IA
MCLGCLGWHTDLQLEEDGAEQEAAEEDDASSSARGTGKAEAQAALLALQGGDAIALVAATPRQHFTQPPPRYTEASLVKALEALGIGRPSTYAAILKVLQVRRSNNSLCQSAFLYCRKEYYACSCFHLQNVGALAS